MPRQGTWVTNNRQKLREYSKQYRRDNPEYFKKYEQKNWLKLKVIRKLWMKKNRYKYRDYYTKEQRREYLRAWRLKEKENSKWQSNYLESLIRQ